MPFSSGQNVGPYRVLEQLGQGGMATVYKAYHAALDRYVALKVLHPAFREEATFLARFTREARVVARLEHPNIVPIYDFSEQDGQPYLVMKYIEGETLKARLARDPLSAEEAVRVVQSVGAALAFAHGKGILHRDIKPSNILLTPDGGIYLADFGLARIAQSGESTLSSDMMLGTPHYISPEQAQGMKNLDEGTDIYSFGVVLYELSVGRVPFNADTPFSIIHDHIFTPLPLPHTINPNVPPAVERVLLKALAKDRKDRYADVDSLVKAFAAAVRGVQDGGRAATTGASKPELPATERGSPKPVLPPTTRGTILSASAASSPNVRSGKSFWTRLPRWLVITVPIFLCICSCLFMIAIIRQKQSEQDLQTMQTETASFRQPVTPFGGVTPVVPVKPAADITPEIPQEAREAWLHLEKAISLESSGDKEASAREFQLAMDMMPPQRSGVILLAVQRLASAGDWMMAGEFIRKGVSADPRNQELRLAGQEVLFHLSEDKEGISLLQLLTDNNPDWATAQATYARWLFSFSSSQQNAEPYMQKAKDNVKDYELMLVKEVTGEYQCKTGNTVDGVRTLQSVLDNPNTPPWLRVETERIIKQWQ